MSFLAYPIALTAAATFAVAIPLAHRAAVRTPEFGGFRPREIASFVRATVRNKWWLIGMGLNVLGFGLNALALSLGRLAVVQPLLTTQLLFALPVNHWLRREPIKPIELLWAAVLVVGLSGFLLIATAGVPTTDGTADRGPAIAAGPLAALIRASRELAAAGAAPDTPPTRLAPTTGVLLGVQAILNKEASGLVTLRPGRCLPS